MLFDSSLQNFSHFIHPSNHIVIFLQYMKKEKIFFKEKCKTTYAHIL